MENINDKTHWLQSPNKNYLGHWDLPEGKDLVLTIKSAQWEEVINPTVKQNSPLRSQEKRVVRFVESGVKPWICNQGNANSIMKSTGVNYMEDSTGCKISLFVGKYKDNQTKEEIDCVRVRSEPVKIIVKSELKSTHKKWDEIIDKLKTGDTDTDTIKEYFTMSEATENQLMNEAGIS